MLRLSEETYKLLHELGGFDFDDGMVLHDLWDAEDQWRERGGNFRNKEEPAFASKNGQLTHGQFPIFTRSPKK